MTQNNSDNRCFEPLVVTLLPLLLLFCAIFGFDLSRSSLITVLLLIISSLSPFLILTLGNQYFIPYNLFELSRESLRQTDLSNKCKPIFLFLIVIFAIEVSISGNLPLFYYMGIFSSNIDYASFGIKSLHGLFNSVCFLYFMLQVNTYNKRNILNIIFPLLLFTLTFARGWLFICIGYWFINRLISLRSLIFHKSRIVNYIFMISGIILSCFIFGIIGQYRVFLSLDDPFWSAQFSLPFTQSLLEWPYVYLVGSSANALNIIEFIQPMPELLPEWLLSKVLPSALSSLIGGIKSPDVYDYENLRIHELVTTSSIHADIYLVSGYIGCFIFFSIFWYFLSYFLKKSCYDKRFLILLPYMILQAYLFPFSNIVLNLPFMLPYIATFIFLKKSDF